MIKVLYDGWPLVRQPDSPAALHLYDLLARLREDVQACVALPAEPAWALPGAPEIFLHPTSNQPASRLAWEQRSLPQLSRRVRADLLHVTSGHAPLFGPANVLFSPASWEQGRQEAGQRTPERQGAAARLRAALVEGNRARGLPWLWPDPAPPLQEESPGALYRAPVSLPLEFFSNQPQAARPALDLPERFVLYHGPTAQPALDRLLEIWRWAAGSLGDDYDLLLVGMDEPGLDLLPGLLDGLETVRALPPLNPAGLAQVYRSSAAVLHPVPLAPWCGALQLGLASARPVIALETALSDALAGPAAYLVPESAQMNIRAFSAALLTILVEDEVAAQLSQAARRQADSWESDRFSQRLGEIYRELALH